MINSTLIQSIVTEKSSLKQSGGQYTFLVKDDATKVDVKNAVKEVYGVEVAKVTISIYPKKTRIIGRNRLWVKRPNYKKATVSLKGKKTIDPSKLKEAKAKK